MPRSTRREIYTHARIKQEDAETTGVAADLAAHEAATGATVHGLGTMSTQNKNAVDIDGGTVDGTTIGGAAPAPITGTVITPTAQLTLADNIKALFGTGEDAEVYYDGTSLWIKAGSVTASDIKLSCGAQKTLELQNTVTKDFNVGAAMLGRGASAPDLIAIGGGSIRYIGFDGGATTEELHGSIEINHEATEEADISFHIHLIQTSTNTGTVQFGLDYTWHNAEHTAYPLGSETSLVSSVSFTGTTGDTYAISFPDITGTGKKIGSQFSFRLYRDPTLDTYPDDVAVETVGLHVECDTMGSRQRFIK